MWEKITTPPETPARFSESSIFTTPTRLNVTPKLAYRLALQGSSSPECLPKYKPDRKVLSRYLKDEHRARFEWQEEIEKLADLLQSVLNWDPKHRATTKDIMSHSWFDIDEMRDLVGFTEEEQAHWDSIRVTATARVEPEALPR